MKIAYLTSYDVLNSSQWADKKIGLYGAGYHLAKTLKSQDVFLEYIGPITYSSPSLIHKFKWHFNRNFFKNDYFYFLEPEILEEYGKRISLRVTKSNSDVVLCPENTIPIAYLNCEQPIVLWTDAPLSASIDLYAWLNNLSAETTRHLHEMEKLALDKCKLIIFLSEWAAQTTIETYGIDPAKIKVIPWGANLDTYRNFDDISSIAESKASDRTKLLFIGVDWFRKGGDIAFAVAKQLNKSGIETELTVVGCEPIIDEPLPKFVKNLGFINKYSPAGAEQINQLFSEAHFLILPSRADFSPHVFCEANSFGLPCISSNVGGIPTLIVDNLNGKTFALDASTLDYCSYIATLMSDREQYKNLVYSSFNEYQTRLNWTVAAQTGKQVIQEIL